MGIVFVVLVLTSIFYYFPRIKQYHYNPINLYIALPGLGFLLFTLSVCISSALPEEGPVKSIPIAIAIIMSLVLAAVHVSIHTTRYGSILFATVNFFMHTILALFVIMTAGLIIILFMIGVNIYGDMLSDFFDDIFDDRD